MKQIKLYTYDDDAIHGGILLEDGSAVCGDTGELLYVLKREDICPYRDRTIWRIVKVYDNWVNIDAEILGDDFTEDGDAE